MESSLLLTVSPGAAAYSRFSVPLPKGRWRGPITLEIRQPDGSLYPVQTWPLGHWPDGSVRALHVVAPLPEGEHRAAIKAGEDAPVADGLRIESEAGGSLRFVGTDLVFQPGRLSAESTGLYPEAVWQDGTVGTVEIEGAPTLLREGPLYTVVEQWAKISANDHRYLRFRFQFEYWRGVEGVGINAMLVNDAPGAEFQEFRRLTLRFSREGASHVIRQSCQGYLILEAPTIETRERVDIRLDRKLLVPYVQNAEVLRDDYSYPHYLKGYTDRVASAVLLKDDAGVVQLEMEDFTYLRPKGIELENGCASFHLWPEWEAPLSLQQGRRRQVRIALYRGHREIPANWGAVGAASQSLFAQQQCQLPSEYYREIGFFDQARTLRYQPDRYPRFETWAAAAAQIRYGADFFDFGDTPDQHYLTGYILQGNSPRIANPDGKPPRMMMIPPGGLLVYDQTEDYEPVWVNNEYDFLYALGTEFLRTSRLFLMKALRWGARHNLEVDFLCFSEDESHHRAQITHSARHTTIGAFPSHFWTQGLTQYYFLTGDEDALEVIRALGDKTMWYLDHPILGGLHGGINREMGWAVLSLVFAYEATGDAKYDAFARKIIDQIISEPMATDLPEINFGETSFLLGCRAYLDVHAGDEATCRPVRDWMLCLLDLAIQSSLGPACPDGKANLQLSYGTLWKSYGATGLKQPRPGILGGFAVPDIFAYAYEITGEERYLRASLRALIAFMHTQRFHEPLPEGKAYAVAYRSWINYLGSLDRLGWLDRLDYPQRVKELFPE